MHDFQTVLYYVFLIEKAFRVDEVAKRMGIRPGTLYSYIEGKRTFPPDRIPDLYRATFERRFLAVLLDSIGVVFFDAPECDSAEPADAVLPEAIKTQKECLDVLQAAYDSLADGRVSRDELHKLRGEVSEAHSALARLLACMNAAHRLGRG